MLKNLIISMLKKLIKEKQKQVFFSIKNNQKVTYIHKMKALNLYLRPVINNNQKELFFGKKYQIESHLKEANNRVSLLDALE